MIMLWLFDEYCCVPLIQTSVVVEKDAYGMKFVIILFRMISSDAEVNNLILIGNGYLQFDMVDYNEQSQVCLKL